MGLPDRSEGYATRGVATDAKHTSMIVRSTSMIQHPKLARAVSRAGMLACPFDERRDIERSERGASRAEKGICGQAKAPRTIYVMGIVPTIT